ncbi:MAG TPA: hypothetical protein VK956_09740 [Verrucomicrobium sp.]|nr:hypothetical protein [Verrucomicrobium sp.]
MKDPTSPHLLELMQRYFSGVSTAEETQQLQQALKVDADLRALYLDFMNLDVALGAAAEAATYIPGAEPPLLPFPLTTAAPLSTRQLRWRPMIAAAAAGLVIGLFSASLVWAYVAPYPSKGATLMVEGFELEGLKDADLRTLPGLPLSPGVWAGDDAQVVTTEQEIKPRGGRRMLRFNSATHAGEDARRSAWGDVYRLVDVRKLVTNNHSALRLSASFNTIPHPTDEEYQCSVELCSLDSDPADAPQPLTLPWVRENSSSTVLRKFPLKNDVAWKSTNVEIPVTPQTRFVLVHLAVLRTKPYPPTGAVQFTGHYVDNVKLQVISQNPTR